MPGRGVCARHRSGLCRVFGVRVEYRRPPRHRGRVPYLTVFRSLHKRLLRFLQINTHNGAIFFQFVALLTA